MDSSDSEEDCYSNVARTLQNLKNKYIDDKIECSNLLRKSSTADKKEEIKPAQITTEKEDVLLVECEEDIALDQLIASNSNKRSTRSSRKSLPDVTISAGTSKNRATKKGAKKRGRGRKSAQNSEELNLSEILQASSEVRASPRGRGRRGRGRGRGQSRGQNRISNNWLSSLWPTYSVGNTDEYPDELECQPLFSSVNTNQDVVLVENDPLDDNEELSVKVYWQSSEVFKFTIRKYQKLVQIFDYFAEKHCVSKDKLFFTYNEKIISSEDTPDSIEYSIAKFIDGGIINQSVSELATSNKQKIVRGIKLKFQCQHLKKPFEIAIRRDEKLSLAMMKCSEHIERPLNTLKFVFDGDCISGLNTPRDLDLEGGECIDVKLLS